jgi:hypothetical protein
MCIPSRDVDWDDCDFDGAYFRIAASWRSADPTGAASPTVELGGSAPFETRVVVNELALRTANQDSRDYSSMECKARTFALPTVQAPQPTHFVHVSDQASSGPVQRSTAGSEAAIT